MIWRRRATFVLLLGICVPMEAAFGQDADKAGAYELSAGVARIGRTSIGSSDATLTGPAGDRFRLFTTASQWDAAPAITVRLGRRVAPAIDAEASATYGAPTLTTTISADPETPVGGVASEALRQVSVEGGAVMSLARWRIGRHFAPFVAGGGGFFRELHEGNTLAQTGKVMYVGGGMRVPFVTRRSGPRVTQMGIRGDIRALVRSGDLALDGRRHVAAAFAAAVFLRF